MLGVIRQNTYHANMHPLQSEFYDFREREDELAASLIAKNIRRLLRRAPSLIEKKHEAIGLSESPQSFSSVNENWPLQVTSQNNENRLFHSDSSLSSNCSSMSSDSYASSSSLSPFSSRTSLSEANRKKSNKDERNVEVVLPNDMMNRMTRDIVRMAEKEPNGIRGCQLQIELQDYDSDFVVSVGKINCDPKIPQNCVLRVHLVSIPPPPEAHGSQILLNRLLGSSSYNLYIKPGYTIEKRKLEEKKANFRL
ncbi:UNVERIFIED_CONTAM: hypothetical protein RMT77_002066 [Armadillidium vulgare]|nr:Protein scylla [Armadillidium vulgare]